MTHRKPDAPKGARRVDECRQHAQEDCGNVFYFFEGNTLRAGVLDHDFIYTPAELAAELKAPESLGQSVFAGKWQHSEPIQEWFSDFQDTGVVDPHAFMDVILQGHGYR